MDCRQSGRAAVDAPMGMDVPDPFLFPFTTPDEYGTLSSAGDGTARLLVDVRRHVQQTLDHAFVNGHIGIEAATIIHPQNYTCGHACFNRVPSSSAHGLCAAANFAAPMESSAFAGADAGPSTLASIPASNLHSSDILPASSGVISVTGPPRSTNSSSRRKRLPKLGGGYPCNYCDKVYNRFGDLTKHGAIHEPGKRMRCRCHLCGKGFSHPKDLRRHSSRPNSACQTLPPTPTTLSPTEVADLTMTDHGYFPPVEQYQAKTSAAKPRSAPAPLLPTPATHDTDLPIFGTDTLAAMPDMSEPIPLQSCSCPISDACILETLALLQGSLSLLRAAYHQQDFVNPGLSALLSEPCPLKTIIIDVLPDLGSFEAPKTASGTSVLLRRDSFLPTPEIPDVCSYVRQRLNEFLLHPVDAFAPIQHCLHAVLTMLGFESADFRARLRHLKTTQPGDETDLMCQAYDHLARSTLKVYASQLDDKVEVLRAAIEGIANHINMGADIRSASTGEIVEHVADTKRFSFSTAKLISISGNAAGD